MPDITEIRKCLITVGSVYLNWWSDSLCKYLFSFTSWTSTYVDERLIFQIWNCTSIQFKCKLISFQLCSKIAELTLLKEQSGFINTVKDIFFLVILFLLFLYMKDWHLNKAMITPFRITYRNVSEKFRTKRRVNIWSIKEGWNVWL